MSMVEGLSEDDRSAPVTFCPTGRRSKAIIERANPDRPTRTLLPENAVISKKLRVIGQSHERYDGSREAIQTEVATLAVGIGQPHRRGARDPRSERLGTALGRFCAPRPVRAYALADHLLAAGERWHEVARAYHYAIDIKVSDRGKGNGEGRDEKQIAADMELAKSRRLDAEAVLNDIMLRRAIGAMDRLTVEDRDPSPYDEDLLVHCLVALARHFRIAPRNIRDS